MTEDTMVKISRDVNMYNDPLRAASVSSARKASLTDRRYYPNLLHYVLPNQIGQNE